MSNVKLVVLKMGYAESSHASFLAIKNRGEPFNSGIEALSHLAQMFLLKYLKRCSDSFDDCCKNSMCSENKFCSTCGRHLSLKEFNAEYFESFIHSHIWKTMNGYGETMIDLGGGWDEFPDLEEILETPQDEILYIHHYAERVLVHSLTGLDLDDENFEFHYLAESYKTALSNYDAWTECETDTRENLAQDIEAKYRLGL